MIYNGLEFHNVAQLDIESESKKINFYRFPLFVTKKMGISEYEKGRFRALEGTGCEIRFTTSGNDFIISLTSQVVEGEIIIYKGDYFHSKHIIAKDIPTSILVEEPERFRLVKKEILNKGRFSSDLWRVHISKGNKVSLNYLDGLGGEIFPPNESEKPKIKYLAYGSSITHGRGATTHGNSYIEQTGKHMGWDPLCKGISGSCYMEKEMADYLALEEWDIATLELGINMLSYFKEDEFEKRARYFIGKMLEKKNPLIIIDIFSFHGDYHNIPSSKIAIFRNILKNIYLDLKDSNLFFIEGKDILPSLHGLTTDLTHPSDDGHILMGHNLSEILKNFKGIEICKTKNPHQ